VIKIPYYDYKCKSCEFEEINRKEHPDNTEIKCPKCIDGIMTRKLHGQFGICMGAAGAHGYYDENLCCYINTNAQRREEMRKQGVTDKYSSPKPYGEAWV
jgi:predicted nucleic acid-binding Zn ribbon protein